MLPPSSKTRSLKKFSNCTTRAASCHGLHGPVPPLLLDPTMPAARGRTQKTEVFLGRSMAQAYVQTFAFPNGRSRKGHPVLVGRSISSHTRPHITRAAYQGLHHAMVYTGRFHLFSSTPLCLPLGVKPRKPRLLWDGRWLNLMCIHSPFQMDGVGKVTQCSWKGAYQ